MFKIVKRFFWLALVLLVAGVTSGCGGFSGSIPISSLMFLQNTTEKPALPTPESGCTNAVADLAMQF
jgi:hypothetical protein